MSLFLIILAAGDSKRLKSNTPKPFHIVNNKTLLEHSFNAFKDFNEIKKTIIVYNKKHKKHLDKLNLKNTLKGSVVGVQGATTHENFVKQVLGDSVTMKSYDTQENLELDLSIGRIDAALSDQGSMEKFMESDKGKEIAFIGPGLGGGSFGGGVGVGLRKADTDLLKMFNKAIDEARADGSLAKHFSKWFGKDISM